jgi:hypothetical protein
MSQDSRGLTLEGSALEYFMQPANRWWKWVDVMNVVEDSAGNTLCYREELEHLLAELANEGLPPLNFILMVLGATKERFVFTQGLSVERLDGTPSWIRLLRTIGSLPADLRTGDARLHLIRTLCNSKVLSPGTSKAHVATFVSGSIDEDICSPQAQPPAATQRAEQWLSEAAEQYPTLESLERMLRTSVSKPPPAMPLETINLPPKGLLEQLEEDEETSPVAQLVRKLTAVLHVPLHSNGASDLPLGGVSDITNRGDYDRLLISELAYDDDTLMARLANNEALFLRREQPPVHQERERILLMDVSLRSWGYPRLLAASAAITCSLQMLERGVTSTYLLGGEVKGPFALTEWERVIDMLAHLDPAAHCASGLQKAIDLQQDSKAPRETFFILPEENLSLPPLLESLNAVRAHLDYLITVDRSGHVKLFAFGAGQRKLINQAVLDPKELVNGKAKEKEAEAPKGLPKQLPAFFHQASPPLYFPSTIPAADTIWIGGNAENGVLALMQDRRLLYWRSNQIGAVEVLAHVPQGKSVVGTDLQKVPLCLTLTAQRNFLIHRVVPGEGIIRFSELEGLGFAANVDGEKGYAMVKSEGGRSFLQKKANSFQLSAVDEEAFAKYHPHWHHNEMKKFINPGYNAVTGTYTIGMDSNGAVFLGQHLFNKHHRGAEMRFTPLNWQQFQHRKWEWKYDNLVPMKVNDHLKLYVITTSDGSQLFVDTRGLLHLRSSNPDLPEMSLVVVEHKPCAAWSADGFVFGSTYFTGLDTRPRKPMQEFFRYYLKRFFLAIRP